MTSYLVDTDVISEARKGEKANAGVRQFFRDAERDDLQLYLSAVTIGELRQGVEIVRHRGDDVQTHALERWLNRVVSTYEGSILGFDEEVAEIIRANSSIEITADEIKEHYASPEARQA